MVLFFVVAYLFCRFKLSESDFFLKSGVPLILSLSTNSLFCLEFF